MRHADAIRPIPKKPLPLSKVYGLLEPGPVVLLSAAQGSRANVMTLSWHTPLEFEPPLLGCVISARNYTFELVRATGECVINVPTAELAPLVVRCGNTSGKRGNKIEALGLTPVRPSRVRAPLLAECFANLECRVVDTRMVERYGFFVLEVVKAWVARTSRHPRTLHHRGRGAFMIAGPTIRLPSRKK